MNTSLDLNYLRPTSPMGFSILIIGGVFTAIMIYIFLNLNEESARDRENKLLRQKQQDHKIKRLYPKQKN